MGNDLIIQLISQAIEKREADNKQPANWLRASGLGKCKRALAYTKLCPELATPIRARGLITFAFGHMIEELYLDLLSETSKIELEGTMHDVTVSDRQKEISLKLSDTLTVTGHIDCVLTIDGTRYVADVKSCNTRKFSELKKSGIDAVDRTYLIQINLYMKALGIDKGKLIYVNKDTNMDICHIIDIAYDPIMLEYAELVAERVEQATMETLPDKEYKPDPKTGNLPWQCNYCSFVNICWANSELGFDSKLRPVRKVDED